MSPKRKAGKPGNPQTAIAYLRLSPRGKRQEDPLGIDVQHEMIQRWADQHGVEILAWHEDRWVSGADEIDDRPALLAALQDIETHGAGYLVGAKRDRIARDTINDAMISRLAERAGAAVVSADGIGNGDDPASQAMRGMMAVFAQFERALIRSRIKNALAIKKARGERTGMVPYGMRATAERLLEPDPVEQAALRRIFELHEQGLGAPRIAKALEAEGTPARGDRWHVTSVTRILQGKSGRRV